jgi:hypothetical protein
MRNSESESGINLNLLMPIALLVVLLIVPFSFNALMHMLAVKRQHNPVTMKIPFDSTSISIPTEVKQYESFEVALNLDTAQFSKFLNEIVSTASEGTSIQGIAGMILPTMKAEAVGETFTFDKLGAQEPLSVYNNTAKWRWLVTPEASGAHSVKFQLHLTTQQNGQQLSKTLDFAEASFSVQSNLPEWFNRNGLWVTLLIAMAIIVIWGLRRRYAK